MKQKDELRAPPPPPPPPPLGYRYLHDLIRKILRQRNLHQDKTPTENQRCMLSHPTQPHGLFQTNGKKIEFGCFTCGEQKSLIGDYGDYFFCKTCDVGFHRGCHLFPRKLTHPYHPQHPLTFTSRKDETGIISDGSTDKSSCGAVLSTYTTSKSNAFVPNKSGSVKVSRSRSTVVFEKCTWCGKNIEDNWFYRCSLCNFILDLYCSQNVPLLLVPNPKSHHHSLTFYPRPLLTPCDACGLVNVLEPSYACFLCNYMVHQSCIDLPRVIKITRHQHRLSHTPYRQSTIPPPCRVCYKTVDIMYGQYSCNHGDCLYVVHSKCATHAKLWDGKELEWEPEDPDESEDIAPFKKVGSGLIKHFSHEHTLKLEKYDGVRDAEKQCQACVLPINSFDFYNCIQCQFFLHKVCAGLLRKLDHSLHIHPLVLDSSRDPYGELYDRIGCSVCSRKFSGFRYKCSKQSSDFCKGVEIDVRCVLVPEFFTHKGHEHPIFITSTSYNGRKNIRCKGCKKLCLEPSYLQCIVCEFSLCYQCVTIPTEVSYKYDRHPLSLCYGDGSTDGAYWCEVCEKKVNPTDWYYTCNECCTTIHVQCLYGCSVYMKPGFKIKYNLPDYYSSEVVWNGNNTRPLCGYCGIRCPSSVYYKGAYRSVCCSVECLKKDKKLAVLCNFETESMYRSSY